MALKTKTPGLKDMFRARPGCFWVGADYSALEVRIVAFFAKDKPFLDAFAAGADIHRVNAQILTGVDKFAQMDEKAQKGARGMAKSYQFGRAYGAGNKTLWQNIKWDFPDVTYGMVCDWTDRYNAGHEAIVRFNEKLLNTAARTSMSEEPFSKRLRLYYGKVKPTYVYNFPIQTFAAWLCGNAMLGIAAELDWDDLGQGPEGMLAQVHDAIELEGPDPLRLFRLLKKHMEVEVTHPDGDLKMVFPITISVGLDWGNQVEVATGAELQAWLDSLSPEARLNP